MFTYKKHPYENLDCELDLKWKSKKEIRFNIVAGWLNAILLFYVLRNISWLFYYWKCIKTFVGTKFDCLFFALRNLDTFFLCKIFYCYLILSLEEVIYIFDSDLVWRMKLMVIKG